MDKKQVFLLLFAVVLVGIIAYLSRDSFEPEDLQIGLTIRPNRVPTDQRANLGPAVQKQAYTVVFPLSRECQLESVKVVKVHEIETNRFAHPLWELVAEDGSKPVKTITYGVPVRGMKPKVKGAQAELLQRGVPYRLLLETTEVEASRDFTLGGR
jgi:hypothetical protein